MIRAAGVPPLPDLDRLAYGQPVGGRRHGPLVYEIRVQNDPALTRATSMAADHFSPCAVSHAVEHPAVLGCLAPAKKGMAGFPARAGTVPPAQSRGGCGVSAPNTGA